ncbi:ubiquinol-cytochrome C chaperone family protein [Vitreimonas flagellata]|uniref:ubiquinol-cytochrome C chaperone family protein n=1 Tax=Vitreimonas flagellata TaxID=2560861 RepID=UPI0010751E97|nr:ubiquinol-cytochrome C chaperone family protein [Vitreimonas flagellata]
MPVWPFKRSKADIDAKRLLEAVTQTSRQPALFGEGRIPDTLEGRFELMALNASLALIRLREAQGVESLAQAFTDKLFRLWDAGLREDGVGDLVVPKRMRKLAASFYGRLSAYGEALTSPEALATVIARNVFAAEAHAFAPALAAYAARTAETQAGGELDALFTSEGWPAYQG